MPKNARRLLNSLIPKGNAVSLVYAPYPGHEVEVDDRIEILFGCHGKHILLLRSMEQGGECGKSLMVRAQSPSVSSRKPALPCHWRRNVRKAAKEALRNSCRDLSRFCGESAFGNRPLSGSCGTASQGSRREGQGDRRAFFRHESHRN